MNAAIIKQLVLKDWEFNRRLIFLGIALGIMALIIISEISFYIGSILYITVMIALGSGLVFLSVVYERKDQTFAFVMSLPISYMEYTTAKMLSSFLIFLIPWSILLVGSLLTVSGGMIPFVVLMVTEMFVAYCLLLAVALVTESEAWTVGIMIPCNLGINFFIYFVYRVPEIADHMEGTTAVWNSSALSILLVEVALLPIILGCAFAVQARKRDFL